MNESLLTELDEEEIAQIQDDFVSHLLQEVHGKF